LLGRIHAHTRTRPKDDVLVLFWVQRQTIIVSGKRLHVKGYILVVAEVVVAVVVERLDRGPPALQFVAHLGVAPKGDVREPHKG
jgi:hypothetical protein